MDYLLLVDACALEGYMDPMVSAGGSGFLPDQLMKWDIVHKPHKPSLASGFVGEVDVTGFAGHVLAGRTASDGSVELGTAVAGADDHGFVHLLTEGL